MFSAEQSGSLRWHKPRLGGTRERTSHDTQMCTLAVFTNAWSDLPLFVAAIRDEFYERPTFAPRHLGSHGLAVGGCDAQAAMLAVSTGRARQHRLDRVTLQEMRQAARRYRKAFTG